MTWHDDISLDAFRALAERRTEPGDVPCAAEIRKNIPVYDAASADARAMEEWARVLLTGPGVLVIRGAVPDLALIDEINAVFEAIIAEERAANTGKGDHFAAAGANDRVWNSLQKLCLHAPALYARYAASPAIDMACRAWLGPGYQIATQLNVVRPGGKAQEPHRDYHLGFMSEAQMRAYPAHVHLWTPQLILQGGVAHCDMPVESGPTKLLPFSQTYPQGYLAALQPEFRAFFEEHHVQLPLGKGDALFFSPALFHAAGENRTADVSRIVNLFQTTSAFGQPMETLDRAAMCRAVFPHLAALDGAGRTAAIAATAAGYPFPTNLDSDPPVGGLAPPSQQDVLRQAVEQGWSEAALAEALAAQEARRRA